jgi:predicted metal-binding membrane protein
MNVAWIAALTLLVLVEKIAPAGRVASKAAGALLLVWAAATFVA